jgi:chloramphenicol 3-O-phosphotransferase
MIETSMAKRFVVVTGLPSSGKSTLAQQLAEALDLPLLDKDHILERLFESKGLGDVEWRRKLSRESDLVLEAQAAASEGAVLVSHWHLPGMPSTSGTPTSWISQLPGKVVNVHCKCSAELSASRFAHRTRHPGHLDHQRSYEEILARIREVASFGTLDLGPRIEVDTSHAPDLAVVLNEVGNAFAALAREE